MKSSIKQLLKSKANVNIQLGGGKDCPRGFINVDMLDIPEVDVVHNFEKIPWPFPDNCADMLVASHLVEHINPTDNGFIKFMDEAWRISKTGCKFMISTPFAGSYAYFQDPTHINPCNDATFWYFDPMKMKGHLYNVYKPKPWKIEAEAWDMQGNLEVLLIKRREVRNK